MEENNITPELLASVIALQIQAYAERNQGAWNLPPLNNPADRIQHDPLRSAFQRVGAPDAQPAHNLPQMVQLLPHLIPLQMPQQGFMMGQLDFQGAHASDAQAPNTGINGQPVQTPEELDQLPGHEDFGSEEEGYAPRAPSTTNSFPTLQTAADIIPAPIASPDNEIKVKLELVDVFTPMEQDIVGNLLRAQMETSETQNNDLAKHHRKEELVPEQAQGLPQAFADARTIAASIATHADLRPSSQASLLKAIKEESSDASADLETKVKKEIVSSSSRSRRRTSMQNAAREAKRDECGCKEFCITKDVQVEKTVEWVCCDNEGCQQWFHTFCVRLNNRKWSQLQPFRCCNNRTKRATKAGREAVTGVIHRKFYDLPPEQRPELVSNRRVRTYEFFMEPLPEEEEEEKVDN